MPSGSVRPGQRLQPVVPLCRNPPAGRSTPDVPQPAPGCVVTEGELAQMASVEARVPRGALVIALNLGRGSDTAARLWTASAGESSQGYGHTTKEGCAPLFRFAISCGTIGRGACSVEGTGHAPPEVFGGTHDRRAAHDRRRGARPRAPARHRPGRREGRGASLGRGRRRGLRAALARVGAPADRRRRRDRAGRHRRRGRVRPTAALPRRPRCRRDLDQRALSRVRRPRRSHGAHRDDTDRGGGA